MRERITIERATVDESSGQPIRTWENHIADEPAEYDPAVGSETVKGRQVEANTKAVFLVHHTDDITTEDRVSFDGETFGIVALLPYQGGRRFLEIHTRGAS